MTKLKLINDYEGYNLTNNRKAVMEIIRTKYSWDKVVDDHILVFNKLLNEK